MSFMQPEIAHGKWIAAETTVGTEYIPQDVVGKLEALANVGDEINTDPPEHGDTIAKLRPYLEGDLQSAEVVEGFGARLSAPGYMDCTDWTVLVSREEAVEHLADTYDRCRTCLAEVNVADDWQCPKGCEQ